MVSTAGVLAGLYANTEAGKAKAQDRRLSAEANKINKSIKTEAMADNATPEGFDKVYNEKQARLDQIAEERAKINPTDENIQIRNERWERRKMLDENKPSQESSQQTQEQPTQSESNQSNNMPSQVATQHANASLEDRFAQKRSIIESNNVGMGVRNKVNLDSNPAREVEERKDLMADAKREYMLKPETKGSVIKKNMQAKKRRIVAMKRKAAKQAEADEFVSNYMASFGL